MPYFVEELTTSAARGCIDMPDTLRDALNVRVQHAVRSGAAYARSSQRSAGNRIDHELLEAVRRHGRRPRHRVCAKRSMRAVLTARRDRLRLPARAAARGGPRRPAARPARAGCTPGSPRCSRSSPGWSAAETVAPGDRPPLVRGARGQQGLPLVASPRPTSGIGRVPRVAADVRTRPGAVGSGRGSGARSPARRCVRGPAGRHGRRDAGENERALALISAALADSGPSRSRPSGSRP